MSLFGSGSGKMPDPVKKSPVRVEPDLDRARSQQDVRSRQRKSLAVQRPFGEPMLKKVTLG